MKRAAAGILKAPQLRQMPAFLAHQYGALYAPGPGWSGAPLPVLRWLLARRALRSESVPEIQPRDTEFRERHLMEVPCARVLAADLLLGTYQFLSL
jgi:hypothetical protein